jgi:hypothetical protein
VGAAQPWIGALSRRIQRQQNAVRGSYAAAIGTILGACILLGRIAIGNWLTAPIGVASLAVLFRWKVHNALDRLSAVAAGLGDGQMTTLKAAAALRQAIDIMDDMAGAPGLLELSNPNRLAESGANT